MYTDVYMYSVYVHVHTHECDITVWLRHGKADDTARVAS